MANQAASGVRAPPALAQAVREGRYLVSPRTLAEALLRAALVGRERPRPGPAPVSGRRPRPARGP